MNLESRVERLEPEYRCPSRGGAVHVSSGEPGKVAGTREGRLVRAGRLLAGVVLLLTPAAPGRADGLVRRPPDDGAWASFYCTEEFDDGVERAHYVTLKSVGAERVDGEPCRWIEVKYQREGEWPKGAGGVWKLLIPEKQLGPAGDPLGHVVKAWSRTADGTRQRDIGESLPRLYLVMPPAVKGLKVVKEEQHFDWQKGRLTSKTVLEGAARQVHKVETVRARYRLAAHGQVPFGVAGAEIELESSLGYKGTVRYWLVDMGTGAASELPDAQ